MGCLNPSWLTSILSPSFFSVLPLFIWPVGVPTLLPCSRALTLMLLTLAPLAPSSPFRARLPWGSKVICAVSSPWGSKVICCSPYGLIVLDSLWLTSLISFASALLWCLLLIGVPHFSLFSRSYPFVFLVAVSACWSALLHPRPPFLVVSFRMPGCAS